MIEHARAESPLEACGYLAEKDGVITAVFRMTNIDASAQHFSLDPAEQFDIDFTVMAGELAGLLKDLTDVLGSGSTERGDWPAQSKVA